MAIARNRLRRLSLVSSMLLVLQVGAILIAPAALAAPAISSCTPTSGPVGTTVTITGTALGGANKVQFNGTNASFSVNQAGTQITTTVPSGATSGPLTVIDNGAGGGTASCPTNFAVTPPQPPTISGFTPTSGPVGTSVIITGTNFNGATAVRFNGTASTFVVNSPTQITATVPAGATDGPVTVQTPAGTATGGSFDVTPTVAPTISSFAPTSGPVGTSVVITGTNFTGATAVRFNGTASTFVINSPTQITATVPAGATDGPISVQNSAGTATSSTSFDVTPTQAPVISSFTPTSGPAGTSVVISGSNFTGATAVRFAGTASTFVVNSPTQITATVPAAAGTGAISVTTPAGTGTSSTSFTVTQGGPTISSFTPASGCVGTTVTLTGTGFTGATTVRFNGVNATSFNVQSATRIAAVVPIGATTGKITVIGPTGTGTSATDFTVSTACAPTIASFTPSNGPVGTTVVITGDDFTGTVTVKFNGVNAPFTVNSDAQITTTVPAGATTGKISITNSVGTGTSTTDFIVTATPAISSFSPSVGPIGTVVTITGTNFDGVSAVRFNGVNATSFTVESSTRIRATVPAGATTGRITVLNSAGSATSATDFTVGPAPQEFHSRAVSLRLSRHLAASGIVIAADNFQMCEQGVNVKIQRRRDGVWRTVKIVVTDGEGAFQTPLRDRRGLYRARVPRTETPEHVCRRATSARVRHRH